MFIDNFNLVYKYSFIIIHNCYNFFYNCRSEFTLSLKDKDDRILFLEGIKTQDTLQSSLYAIRRKVIPASPTFQGWFLK